VGIAAVGRADLGVTTICGGISRPSKDCVFMGAIGVGRDGLAPTALCAKAPDEKMLSPSAWLRIKPKILILEGRKWYEFILFRCILYCMKFKAYLGKPP
jgi:hypothetical protein